MVIVHILNSLILGGREKVVVDICNAIDTNEHQVYIITLSNNKNELLRQLNSNVKCISLPYKKESPIKIWASGIFKINKILKTIKPDIIHSHLYFHYFLFFILCLRYSKIKAPHFRTVHTSGLFYNSDTVLNKIRLYTEKIATQLYPTYIISISDTIYKQNNLFFGKYAKKIKKIPNGIRLQNFNKDNFLSIDKYTYGINNQTIVVTYVSRLDIGKNHKCLIDAWEKVIQIIPKAQLCFLGDGILEAELKQTVKQKKLEKSVIFYGIQDNVAGFLSITDIAVFPSQFEGFPIALIEKMAMALPVITSDIDIFKEIITSNKNGLLTRLNDTDDLAKAIVNLAQDKQKRNDLGENAQKTAQTYDINQVVLQTLKFYEETQ